MKNLCAKILTVIAAAAMMVTAASCTQGATADEAAGDSATTTTTAAATTTTTTAAETTAAPAAGAMRDITTLELVNEMGIGINIGNTLEACNTETTYETIANYETSWGSPLLTEAMIKGYKDAGFGVVRIPVAWSNLMSEDYTIHPDLMNRVEEVSDWVIANGMYAIINIHWDGGWWTNFQSEETREESFKKYTRIWEQISERLKDKSDYLMFESLNEELGFDQLWNRYNPNDPGKPNAYALGNEINQIFVDVVRASGGNNAERHLLIAGYNTDIDLTCDPLFLMPNDPANRMAVSVHYYTPSTFAILDADASWGKAQTTWGSQSDIDQLEHYMAKMEETFVAKGIPVIIGEYGCAAPKNKTTEEILKYNTAVCKSIYEHNMCPVYWDVATGSLYERSLQMWIDQDLVDQFHAIEAAGR
jgi:endoglucanase